MSLRHAGLYADIPLHLCERCATLWMAPESLDRLDDNINVEASKLDWQPTGEASTYRCPVCPGGYRDDGPILEALALAGRAEIVVYRCLRCEGMLLDKPTLGQIRTAVIAE